jgi:hypothetical protein
MRQIAAKFHPSSFSSTPISRSSEISGVSNPVTAFADGAGVDILDPLAGVRRKWLLPSRLSLVQPAHGAGGFERATHSIGPAGLTDALSIELQMNLANVLVQTGDLLSAPPLASTWAGRRSRTRKMAPDTRIRSSGKRLADINHGS